MRLGTLSSVLAAGFAAAVLTGCGGKSSSTAGPSGGGGGTTAGEGTVTVLLTDSPFSGADAVLVTFSEVTAHKSGGPFFTVPFSNGADTRTCDLKKLVGAQDVLGTGPLEAGHYTQLRLVVTSGFLYFDNAPVGPACAMTITAPTGESAQLELPSREIKLNREFDVAAGQGTTITLDFDGDRSIHETGSGKFMMKPVIAVVSVGP